MRRVFVVTIIISDPTEILGILDSIEFLFLDDPKPARTPIHRSAFCIWKFRKILRYDGCSQDVGGN